MKSATLSIKIDPTLKDDAQKVAQEFGMPLGTLVSVLLKNTVRTKELNVDASEQFPAEQMTPQMEKIIGEVDADIRAGRTEGPFTAEEFLTILDKEIEKNKVHERTKARQKH